MKRSIYIITGIVFLIALIIFLFNSINSLPQNSDPLKILFLGNSYTFNNDLPSLFKEISTKSNKGLSMEIKAFTPGGAKLEDHINSSFTMDIIGNGSWDIVVMQGHSLEPLKNPSAFTETATELIRIAKESGADVYLFETWSRAAGHSVYSEAWSGGNPDSMQEKLSMKYREIAQKSGVTVIPIGSTWQSFMRENQDMELYSNDGSHPTHIGSYLTACTIYSYIFNEDPGNINYVPSTIKESEAEIVRAYLQ